MSWVHDLRQWHSTAASTSHLAERDRLVSLARPAVALPLGEGPSVPVGSDDDLSASQLFETLISSAPGRKSVSVYERVREMHSEL